ncbi:MAG: PDZ domain-containing protein, partial [Phycisphaeraceae bacterium]|nr:PDZ domain-containing protein [Phycisphaeraceae bacterium]
MNALVRSSRWSLLVVLLLALVALPVTAQTEETDEKDYSDAIENDPRMKEFFLPTPQPRGRNSNWLVKNVGPTGLEVTLKGDQLNMHINKVIEGSPAAKTGKFRAGQTIVRVNGRSLTDGVDPRIMLGHEIA